MKNPEEPGVFSKFIFKNALGFITPISGKFLRIHTLVNQCRLVKDFFQKSMLCLIPNPRRPELAEGFSTSTLQIPATEKGQISVGNIKPLANTRLGPSPSGKPVRWMWRGVGVRQSKM